MDTIHSNPEAASPDTMKTLTDVALRNIRFGETKSFVSLSVGTILVTVSKFSLYHQVKVNIDRPNGHKLYFWLNVNGSISASGFLGESSASDPPKSNPHFMTEDEAAEVIALLQIQ